MSVATVLAVAALTLAGAALGLAIVLLRQSGEALGSIRSHLRHHERTLDPEVAEDRQQLIDLTGWAHRADGMIAELAEFAGPTPHGDQPATAHLERHDLPTSAMPTAERPEPRPRSATGLDGTATP